MTNGYNDMLEPTEQWDDDMHEPTKWWDETINAEKQTKQAKRTNNHQWVTKKLMAWRQGWDNLMTISLWSKKQGQVTATMIMIMTTWERGERGPLQW